MVSILFLWSFLLCHLLKPFLAQATALSLPSPLPQISTISLHLKCMLLIFSPQWAVKVLLGGFYEAFIAPYSLEQVMHWKGNQKETSAAPFLSLCCSLSDKIDCKIALLSVMMSPQVKDECRHYGAAVGLLAHLGDTGYLAFCSVCTF